MSSIRAESIPTDGPVSVVVPTYNEAESIATLIERVMALGDRYRVLVVDDSSPMGPRRSSAPPPTNIQAGSIFCFERRRKESVARMLPDSARCSMATRF